MKTESMAEPLNQNLLAIDSSDNSFTEIESRQELIRRGNDCIQTRIMIKKSCKKTMSSLEALLNKISTENNNKEIVKPIKNKFLTSVSVLDKLQLEWQKYDLGLKH